MIFEPQEKGLHKARMDWLLVLAVLMITTIGTLAIMSATVALPAHAHIVRTHFIALPLAALLFMFGWSFNYQVYQDQWKILYGVLLAALVAVLLAGSYDRGSRSWFKLPFFSVQPSEPCRIAMILVFANYLDRNAARIRESGVLLKGVLLTVPFFYLLMKQPDFSACAITFPVIIGMLYCAGARMFHLIVILGYGFIAGSLPLLWTFLAMHPEWLEANGLLRGIYSLASFGLPTLYFCGGAALAAWLGWRLANKFRAYLPSLYFIGGALVVMAGFLTAVWAQNQLKEYQRKRFEVFLAPEVDPKGASYNLLQAQIGMGAGGFFGRGVFSGTQSRLGFVPERHTDFVLSVVGEEMGFIGTLGVLLLYLFMLRRIMDAGQVSRDQYGYLVCCGIFALFSVYMVINFGMLSGLLPVAGIPLPLVSYGGSNLVASLWAAGLVESVYARRMAIV
ncbi:MAG: rod shape-determining protein RodA [Elusimicrobiales bacterium]